MEAFAHAVRQSPAFFIDAAWRAAHALGLAHLAQQTPRLQPRSVEDIAAALELPNPRRLRPLLDLLAELSNRVQRVDEGQYRFDAEPFPQVAPSPAIGWGQLNEVIRRDEPLPILEDPDALERYQAAMNGVAGDAAAALWSACALPPSPSPRLLDVGGGLGAYTLAFLDRHPEASATLLDQPDVIALARSRCLSPRVRFIADDFLSVEVTSAPNVILLSNVLHLHGPSRCEALIQKAYDVCAPGGTLLIKDLSLTDTRSGPRVSLLFALNMALFTAEGDVYRDAEVRCWMQRAGWSDIHSAPLESSADNTLWRATR